MPGGVHRRTVVERIWINLRLNAKVTMRPATRVNLAANERGDRTLEFIALVVINEVAPLDHEVGSERPNSSDSAE